MDDVRFPISVQPIRFADRLRKFIRQRNLAYATEKTYIYWIMRFIKFNAYRNESEIKQQDIEPFLDALVFERDVAKNTQSLALNALVFLFRSFLEIDIGELNYNRSTKSQRIPVVFTHEEAKCVLSYLQGDFKLMAELMYGSGLRIHECIKLRVHDIDFSMNQIIVRNGKGGKDRLTVLPQKLLAVIKKQIDYVTSLHSIDVKRGYGEVYLPHALALKYPNAARILGWQYLFPAIKLSCDPRSNKVRRHHIGKSTLQRQVKIAIGKTGILKQASSHTFRHAFATRLLQKGYDIRTVQKLLGHNDIKTTEIYLHIIRQGGQGVISPIDED